MVLIKKTLKKKKRTRHCTKSANHAVRLEGKHECLGSGVNLVFFEGYAVFQRRPTPINHVQPFQEPSLLRWGLGLVRRTHPVSFFARIDGGGFELVADDEQRGRAG